ncbi:MAG: Branched-chain amino acid transporter, amino acid-binding protein [Chthoniobacteraceae bacterium]|nr:Branched-chain amino acid transporter, amino acid-binding protein [Chthoniobacteraceae bacterium]
MLAGWLMISGAFGQAFLTTGSLSGPRFGHTSGLLADGRVLIAGGGLGSNALATAELYNPATGRWAPTGSMHFPRYGPRSVVLSDGRVLVVEGSVSPQTSAPQHSAELYDPATGTWADTGTQTMTDCHTLTLLPDGKVLLIANGPTAELYDAATGTWRLTGPMVSRRTSAQAALLPSGKVLIYEGQYPGLTINSELYDPTTKTFAATGSFYTERSLDASTILANGEVLIAGGQGPYSGGIAPYLNSVEIYNPTTGAWRNVASLLQPRNRGSASLLADGRVLIHGGTAVVNGIGIYLPGAELYDPLANTWTVAGPMLNPRDISSTTRLADGRVLIAGGSGNDGALSSAELFDPAAPRISAVTIASNHPGAPALGWIGDVVTLSFTATQSIAPPTVTLLGQTVTATKGTGETWTASATVTSATPGGPVALSIAYQTASGAVAAPVRETTDGSAVTIDKTTIPPTTTPSNGVFSTSMSVTFDLPEIPLAGSVKLLFRTYNNWTPVSTLTLATVQEVAGNRTLTFDPGNPTANPQIASGAPIPDGEYNILISYQDAAGNPAASVMVSYLRIDTVPPVIMGARMTPPWARPGATVSVVLTINETGIRAVSGTIAGQPISTLLGPPVVVRVTLPGNVPEGPLSFSVAVTDAAGNVSATVTTAQDGVYTTVDRIAPVLTVPGAITAEATTASGAIVTYQGTATDDLDPVPLVNSSPSSGSRLHLGTTKVQMTATDHAGNQITGTFTVTVVDTTKPAANVPAGIMVVAGPTGEAVLGDLTGRLARADLVTPAAKLLVAQSPPAGTVLPLGAHTVSFTVTDAAGNFTTVQTMVTVSFAVAPSGAATVAAITGRPAPATPGLPEDALLATFGTPALSDFRHITARVGMLSGKKKIAGIYLVDGGDTASLPAFQGGPVPDAMGVALPAVTFKSFLDPVTAPAGAIAFTATLAGAKATMDDGVWTDAFGPLALVLREGEDVPGLPAGTRLKSVTSLSLQDGSLVALVKLAAAKGLVSAGRDDVALVELSDVGTGILLLRTGADLGGSTIKTIATLAPALGSPGQGRWYGPSAVLAKVTLASTEVRLVKVSPQGTLTALLSTAGSANAVDANARWKGFGVPAMSGDGTKFVVAAALTQKLAGVTSRDNTALLFKPAKTAWAAFAREGALAPIASSNDGPRYAAFFDPVVNEAGQVAFLATLQGAGVKANNKSGLFCGEPNYLRLAARLGDSAPDADGTPTAAVWSKFITHALSGGPGGGIIFLAETTGGGLAAKYNLALYAADSTGKVRRLLRTGEALVPGGPLLTDLELLAATPGAYGSARSYNTTASLAVFAAFANKSQALLRVDIP